MDSRSIPWMLRWLHCDCFIVALASIVWFVSDLDVALASYVTVFVVLTLVINVSLGSVKFLCCGGFVLVLTDDFVLKWKLVIVRNCWFVVLLSLGACSWLQFRRVRLWFDYFNLSSLVPSIVPGVV